MSSSKGSLVQAITALREISSSGVDLGPARPDAYHLGPGRNVTGPDMYRSVSRIERRFSGCPSWELEYWLGIALRNYTTWFLRGDDRIPCLKSAVLHLERAYLLSEGEPLRSGRPGERLDRTAIAIQLGFLLVEEPAVLDLKKGVSLLRAAFLGTDDYDPAFCSLVEGLSRLGDQAQAAEVALELRCRAERSSEWRGSLPQFLLEMASRAKRPMQGGQKSDVDWAIELVREMMGMRIASGSISTLAQEASVGSGQKG